ncbi:RNA polymerase sigma factor SigF [Pseudofrankia sp. DC12]|uniref:RNA polymerase sigma factor SigF n=1 Tax=Pseudofrankia sp. DC12 TaxID=683315 RepID=UPI000A045EC8|nr:RNA polymerase sigma factor SigF [Pseudofrankia sp. DC12]
MTSAGRTPTTPRDRFSSLNQRAGGPDEAVPDAPEGAGSRRSRPAQPASRSDTKAGAPAASPSPAAGSPGAPGTAATGPARAAEPELTDDTESAGTDVTDLTDGERAGAAIDGTTNEDTATAPQADTTASDAGEHTERPADRTSSPDRAHARALFARLVELPEGDTERAAIRDQLVRMHLPLVEYLARRFRNRGEPLDDLVQVATIGLIKSVDRFDPERGVEFSTYATPTIVGEIKRHFRDKGWAIRVPRRLQELKLSLTKATSELSQSLGRSPTVAEIASHLQMSEEEVLEGLESANAYSAVSLDAPDSGDDEAPAVADTLGVPDESLEGVEYRESLKPLLEKLPPREKRILLLRFFGNMTQSQIAIELGISQMHVSRLLARTLAQLRRGLLEDN